MSDVLYIFVCNSLIPWEVNDISMGGLSFQYSPIRGAEIESERIDIVDSHSDVSDLSNIMCSVVYDHFVLSEGLRFRGKEERRRGLKFVELTETQIESLDLLLNNARLARSG